MSPTTARRTFRETVALVAEKAKATLPTQVNGRIEAAARLVVNGDVEPLEDGSIKVGGSDPTRWYHLMGQACTCTDFVQGKAPDGWCKHRIAAGIAKRVRELLPVVPEVVEPFPDNDPEEPAPPSPAVPAVPPALPEAPASVNCHITIAGRQAQLTLRDSDEGRLLQRLRTLLAQYPVQAPGHAQGSPQGQEQGWCAVHEVAMRQTTKDGRSWFSHRKEDGSWCKGKGR